MRVAKLFIKDGIKRRDEKEERIALKVVEILKKEGFVQMEGDEVD